MSFKKSYEKESQGKLYLVPTPIGNLDDMTFRAVNVLKDVDYILCEDTRESLKLLKHFDINKKLVACHEYNEDSIKNNVINDLKSGKNIGLITDQGSPIISDPGYILTREVIKNNISVISLPGATAFVPALSSSGVEPSPFLFYGFLNSKQSKMKEELKGLKSLKYTLIFYESVHRIEKTLELMHEVFGNRKISISRELSKVHEEIYYGDLESAKDEYKDKKGEFVIVVEGNKEEVNYNDLDIVEHVKMYLDDNSEMDAIKIVSKERGVSKSEIYKYYHDNK
ncbi:MAG: 16S rRNA (cytidine(1402)-2'-O)-methyltransferase [Bacilli bacterium]|nr:16S rRNA (cytidine(1402)-2'-O)-methyltransferase [Bacilli bacterium]